MKRDEIRLVQSVLALNRPELNVHKKRETAEAEYKLRLNLWESVRDDLARSIKMRNPQFNLTLFLEGCAGEVRKPVTLDMEGKKHGKAKG